jgi:hypothetical protein
VTSGRPALIALLTGYFLLSLGLLFAWEARGVYTVTGDEPHYLIITDALLADRSLDVQAAYQREITSPSIYPLGLSEPDVPLTPPDAHVVQTPTGTFSWHGSGVAFLATAPYALAGITGVKIALVAVGALAVVMSWSLAQTFVTGRRLCILIPAAVALGYPLIGANTQIYPDLVAGIASVMVIWWLLSERAHSQRMLTVAASLSAALLPWLGMKFSLSSAVLVSAMVIVVARNSSQDRPRAMGFVLVPYLGLIGLLGVFHVWAFGNVLGPPTAGATLISPRAAFTAVGLVIDQNQGVLIQNPTLWFGVVGVGLLWRRSRLMTVTWILVFLAIWIPGSLHPNWYSPGSFVGRYSWALAVLLIIPAIIALGAVARKNPRLAGTFAVLGILWNLALIARIALTGGSAPNRVLGVDLYTRDDGTWLETASVFVYPAHRFFPVFTDPDWAWGYGPNWMWLMAFLAAVVLAVLVAVHRGTRLIAPVAAVLIVGIGVGAFLGEPGPRREVVAVPDGQAAEPGYIAAGQPRAMRLGPYAWSVTYAADGNDLVGKWELVRGTDGVVVASGELMGTNGQMTQETIEFPYVALQPTEYILRIGSYAAAPMRVQDLGVAHAGGVLR